MFVQVSFEPIKSEITSRKSLGAIGIDFNSDHIAVAEVDRFGNPIDAKSYYFHHKGKSSSQNAAIFGDIATEIVLSAKAAGKPVYIEDLEFAAKKSALKEEGSKNYRRLMSSLSYRKFARAIESRSTKEGVRLSKVNPAFTSLIGFFKYRLSSMSTHECAAVAIARRGLRYSERPKVHGTRKGTVSILGEHDPREFFKKNSVRHVWSFYSRNSQNVRGSIRSFNKKVPVVPRHIPLYPSARREHFRIFGESSGCIPAYRDTA